MAETVMLCVACICLAAQIGRAIAYFRFERELREAVDVERRLSRRPRQEDTCYLKIAAKQRGEHVVP